jgi:hypothetical protein
VEVRIGLFLYGRIAYALIIKMCELLTVNAVYSLLGGVKLPLHTLSSLHVAKTFEKFDD